MAKVSYTSRTGPVLLLLLPTITFIVESTHVLSRTEHGMTHHYHLISRQTGYTWQEGQTECQTIHNGRLAALDGLDTSESIHYQLQRVKWFWENQGSSADEKIWLGGRKNLSLDEWMWLRDGRPVQDIKGLFMPGTCMALGVNRGVHVLNPSECNSRMGQFLCSLPEGLCLSHSTPDQYELHDGVCLTLALSSVREYNWYEARNYCLRLGGDLASLGEVEWTQYRHSGSVWVGAHKQPWVWATGKEISFTKWVLHQPYDKMDAPCLVTSVDGWSASSCSERMTNILCEEIAPAEDESAPFSDTNELQEDAVPSSSPTPAATYTKVPGCANVKYGGFHNEHSMMGLLPVAVLCGFIGGIVTGLVCFLIARKFQKNNSKLVKELSLAHSTKKQDRAEDNIYVMDSIYQTIGEKPEKKA